MLNTEAERLALELEQLRSRAAKLRAISVGGPARLSLTASEQADIQHAIAAVESEAGGLAQRLRLLNRNGRNGCTEAV